MLQNFLWRFLASGLVLGGLALPFETLIAQAWLPLASWEIPRLDDTYRLQSLTLDHEGADQVVRLVVSQQRSIVLNDRLFFPNAKGRANASTLLGNICLPVVLLAAWCFAWPVKTWASYGWRGILLPWVLALVWALDVPMVLWGGIWSLHVEAFAPQSFSPLLAWVDFLQNGGRYVLCLLGAWAITSTSASL